MRESKGKSICSLLRDKVAHGSTVDEDLDRGVVEGAMESHRMLMGRLIEAADREWFLNM